jgi:hypothetical protein
VKITRLAARPSFIVKMAFLGKNIIILDLLAQIPHYGHELELYFFVLLLCFALQWNVERNQVYDS